MDSHRIPTSDITLSRTHDSAAPFDREEFKDIIGCKTEKDVTYYKTRFHDDTILWLTSDAFDNPDYIRSFNKKWRKRLHKSEADRVKAFPKVDSSNAKWYPYTQLIPHLPETMTQRQTKKRRKQVLVPRGPRPKRTKMDEDYVD